MVVTEALTKLDETQTSLKALQGIDVKSLGRRDTLGDLNFEEIIPSASRLVELFNKIPTEVLSELPETQLNIILQASNSTRKLFDDVTGFDLNQANPGTARSTLIGTIERQYNVIFPKLHEWISFGVARTVDFNGLDADARAVVKGLEDRSKEIQLSFDKRQQVIDGLEEQLRSTLAEQGVSQQAKYFGSEADKHSNQADRWEKSTGKWATAVAAVAFASFFTHRIPWIAPENIPEAVQFIASKILLIGALSFMLLRSARNYRAHKHNEVINRHKQNSLLTFNALVEAGSTTEARNTVLNHAAASIYGSPESGYLRGNSDAKTSNTTLVEMVPRVANQFSEGAT